MKILTAGQIRETDQYTIDHEPVISTELMERAANIASRRIKELLAHRECRVKIFCGTGNNGGDGFVIARLLETTGTQCDVYALDSEKGRSSDCAINYARLKAMAPARLHHIEDENQFPEIEKTDILIDAIFGTGLSRPIEGLPAKLILHINSSGAEIIAIDMPSGLPSEAPLAETGIVSINENTAIIRAKHTLTFQLPKLSFLFCENYPFTGQWEILEIGLNQEFIENAATKYHYTEKQDVVKLLRQRHKCDHKGTFGHALLWAGAYGKMGAAVLCAHACLRTGAGLTTAYIPGCGYDIMQTSLPEVMVIVDSHKKFLADIPDTFYFTTLGIGPGIGKATTTKEALGRLLKYFKRPVVLDADALNIIAEEPSFIDSIPANSILTPHPKEFSRLAGESKNDRERFDKATDFAADHNCILVLKSAYTSIHLPDGTVYFNSTGNPGMAKGGSGDVLTGMLTALISQGYEPKEAAVLGVYLHGLAGDIASEKYGQYSMTASDIIKEIGEGFKILLNPTT